MTQLTQGSDMERAVDDLLYAIYASGIVSKEVAREQLIELLDRAIAEARIKTLDVVLQQTPSGKPISKTRIRNTIKDLERRRENKT